MAQQSQHGLRQCIGGPLVSLILSRTNDPLELQRGLDRDLAVRSGPPLHSRPDGFVQVGHLEQGGDGAGGRGPGLAPPLDVLLEALEACRAPCFEEVLILGDEREDGPVEGRDAKELGVGDVDEEENELWGRNLVGFLSSFFSKWEVGTRECGGA